MQIKNFTIILLALISTSCYTAEAPEEPEPGKIVLYGAREGSITRGDRDTILHYVQELEVLAKENNPKNNVLYQKEIASVKTYAQRYLGENGSEKQLAARKAFLAKFMLPSHLEVPRAGQSQIIFRRLFADHDMERWAANWTTATPV